jgi:hypothetical protein
VARWFGRGGHVGCFWLIESGYVDLDVQVPGESPVIIGTVGIGGLLGWSWLLPPYQWAFSPVSVGVFPVSVGVRRGVPHRGQGDRVQSAGRQGPLRR